MNRSSAAGFVAVVVHLLVPASLWAQDFWSPTSIDGAPSDRIRHTAVWTGGEMIVWGGDLSAGVMNTGGRYDPATDTWRATSVDGAPDARWEYTAIWTGKEMIIWGGMNSSGSFPLNTGGRYHPGEDRWTPTPAAGAPTARTKHTAVWTGKEMIVWGGYDAFTGGGCSPNMSFTTQSGARFDPESNTWTSMSTTGAPIPRGGHVAVWTGQEMIVWGGEDSITGGRYNPETDSWAPMTDVGTPTCTLPTAIWTGAEMVVWGARVGVISGGRYSPETDSWTLLSTVNAPTARYAHTAVWTGQEMIVWGGSTSRREETGARYSMENDAWVATSLEGAPQGRMNHTAVWTGSRMIVWGGLNNDGWSLGNGSSYGFDATPPAPGRVGDGSAGDLVTQGDLETISANWSGFDDSESGIARYDWAVGTSPGATDVMPFTDTGSSMSASVSGLALEPGVTYYVTVRATNKAGESVIATSDGVRVEAPVSKPARCSAAADATPSGSALAALFGVALVAGAFMSLRAPVR